MYTSNWFQNLNRPPLAPPDWLFAPVWTVLYCTIIISLILFARTNTNAEKTKGYIYFALQMILNLLWSPVFFLHKDMFLAFVILILMAVFVFLTIKEFFKVNSISGLILIPYFVWILFASYLNLGYLIINQPR